MNKKQPLKVLIAPNAFKHSLTARDAATAIMQGLMQSNLNCETICFPIGDGGDGTGVLLTEIRGGSFQEVIVKDPLGRTISASFGLLENGKTAVIEMASASGIHLLKADELNPMKANSYGTGELVKMAIQQGAEKIIMAVGGSATVDGGVGMLHALGYEFLNKSGESILPLPENLIEIDKVDDSAIDPVLKKIKWVVLCDVKNPLLGKEGAPEVFGPQKGASKEQVQLLEKGLTNWSDIINKYKGISIAEMEYGGAAGGIAAGLYAFLNATLVDGIDYFLEATHFEEALKVCDLLITGEGSIDEQTLQGKGPFGVAACAKKLGIPVIGLAGKVPLHPSVELQHYFEVLIPINNALIDMPTALSVTSENLKRTSRDLGQLLAMGSKLGSVSK